MSRSRDRRVDGDAAVQFDELVERSLARGDVSGIAGGDEQHSMVSIAVTEATGTTSGKKQKKAKNDVSDRDVVVMGSGTSVSST